MIKFENKENGRFYYIKIEKDLLNDLVLRINFGGHNVTRSRVIMCDSAEILFDEIKRLYKKRLSRGYLLVN